MNLYKTWIGRKQLIIVFLLISFSTYSQVHIKSGTKFFVSKNTVIGTSSVKNNFPEKERKDSVLLVFVEDEAEVIGLMESSALKIVKIEQQEEKQSVRTLLVDSKKSSTEESSSRKKNDHTISKVKTWNLSISPVPEKSLSLRGNKNNNCGISSPTFSKKTVLKSSIHPVFSIIPYSEVDLELPKITTHLTHLDLSRTPFGIRPPPKPLSLDYFSLYFMNYVKIQNA